MIFRRCNNDVSLISTIKKFKIFKGFRIMFLTREIRNSGPNLMFFIGRFIKDFSVPLSAKNIMVSKRINVFKKFRISTKPSISKNKTRRDPRI